MFSVSFNISEDLPELIINENTIIVNDEQEGNGDGNWNPSENVSISFEIHNNSAENISGLNLVATTLSEYINIENSELYLGSIGPHGVLSVDNLVMSAASNMSDEDNPEIRIELFSSSDDLHWNYILPIDFISGNLNFDLGNGNILEPGSSVELFFNVTNAKDQQKIT